MPIIRSVRVCQRLPYLSMSGTSFHHSNDTIYDLTFGRLW